MANWPYRHSGNIRWVKNGPLGGVKITAEKLSRKTPAEYQKVAQSESLLLKRQRRHKSFDGDEVFTDEVTSSSGAVKKCRIEVYSQVVDTIVSCEQRSKQQFDRSASTLYADLSLLQSSPKEL